MKIRSTQATRFLFGLVFIAATACGGGNDDPSENAAVREQATEINDLTCERIHECLDSSQIQAIRLLVPETGDSVEECKDNMRARNADANAMCPGGKSYHADRADQCLMALADATCQDFLVSLMLKGGPEPCSSICS
ncbi:MAG: hypothetical protein JW940_20455 [Polyangiaceae bacterium]|nr:hypothetical protein [Polyangiaceae bacterium]